MWRGARTLVVVIAASAVANMMVNRLSEGERRTMTPVASTAKCRTSRSGRSSPGSRRAFHRSAGTSLSQACRNGSRRSKPDSWEAHYEETFTQMSPFVREMAAYGMICNGRKWAVHLLRNPDDATQMQAWQAACDGKQFISSGRTASKPRYRRRMRGSASAVQPTLSAFLPQMPAEDALRCGVDVAQTFRHAQ